jgi:HK97 family phage prohead protease
MSEVKRLSCQLVEIKADGDANSNEGEFSGYGATFGNLDHTGDIIKAGAFAKSLNDWGMKGELPFLFAFHDMSRPIGDWLEMREDEKGLYVRGRLWTKGDRRIEDAVMAYNMLRGTGRKNLSIGYRVKDYEMQESVNGSVRILKEIDLIEVSIVPIPANDMAKITAVKSLKDEEGNILSKREVERALRDAGLSTRQAKAFIAGGYEALERDAKELVEPAGREDQLDEAGILASLQKALYTYKGGIS